MSKTYKIQKAYRVFKSDNIRPFGTWDRDEYMNWQTCGRRYGNQRKFQAYLKWTDRKNRRHKENREFQRELRDETSS